MAGITYFVALPFDVADGIVVVGEPIQCPSPTAAIERAQGLWKVLGHTAPKKSLMPLPMIVPYHVLLICFAGRSRGRSVLDRTGREHSPRIFHALTCAVRDSFCTIATTWVLKTPTNPIFRGFQKVAASSWGRAGRARSGLGRGGVGM